MPYRNLIKTTSTNRYRISFKSIIWRLIQTHKLNGMTWKIDKVLKYTRIHYIIICLVLNRRGWCSRIRVCAIHMDINLCRFKFHELITNRNPRCSIENSIYKSSVPCVIVGLLVRFKYSHQFGVLITKHLLKHWLI